MEINNSVLQGFEDYLRREEKSPITREKYLRDCRRFSAFLGRSTVTKEQVLGWKAELISDGYAARSVNSMLASVNSLLTFLELPQCRVKSLRIQRQCYVSEDRELTRAEYLRLLKAAEKKEQLALVLQTICATGIRVSELAYFTVEAVGRGEVTVQCKNKIRQIFLPGKLRSKLLSYAKQKKITAGAIFITRTGKPLNRTSIWSSMKKLCAEAGVKESKVFPHNLRKLFARIFYSGQKDIAKLADVLGHSSINTTRIYIITDGTEHRCQIEKMGLVV